MQRMFLSACQHAVPGFTDRYLPIPPYGPALILEEFADPTGHLAVFSGVAYKYIHRITVHRRFDPPMAQGGPG